ncbi:MAG: RluA family pseudouridine synthase [Clostridia bacterium]|nr:RluA family pseudouridine synthase [Clostridia bacterium]
MEEIENFIISADDINKRLDMFLLEKFPDRTRSFLKNLIEKEKVFVNDKTVKSGYKLKQNDSVSVTLPEPEIVDIVAENIPIDIVYEDDYLAVINKPQNMVVHPAGSLKSGTLVNALMYHMKSLSSINGEVRPGIVHRLDKDTSGLIVIAKDDKTHLSLQKQIQEKTCHRIYRAVAYGKFNQEEGTIETCLARGRSQHEKIFVVPFGQGRIAITNYKVLNYNKGFSYVEYELKTGRTHQIRVHSSHLNHPIVGDKVYGKKGEKFNLAGQLLHAYKLVFVHPVTGENMEFCAEIPDYFKKFLDVHF